MTGETDKKKDLCLGQGSFFIYKKITMQYAEKTMEKLVTSYEKFYNYEKLLTIKFYNDKIQNVSKRYNVMTQHVVKKNKKEV